MDSREATFRPEVTHVSGGSGGGRRDAPAERSRCGPGIARPCTPECCTPYCDPSICDPEYCPPNECDPGNCVPLCSPRFCDPDCMPNCGPICAPELCGPDCDPNCCPEQPCSPEGPCQPSPTRTQGQEAASCHADEGSAFEPARFDPTDPTRVLCFPPHVQLEGGAVNAALFDFATGRVVSLNAPARRIAERIREGLSNRALASWWCDEGGDPAHLEQLCAELAELSLLVEAQSSPSSTAAERTAAAAPSQGLRFLWLELTSRCNLCCVHCYAECRPEAERSREGMPVGCESGGDLLATDDALRIISEAAAAGCTSLQLTGGEPTLHPALPTIIRHARRTGISFIEVYTNGTLLNSELLETFRDEEVHVAVSFYSHRPEVHDRITGAPGSWAATLKAMRKLRDAGVPLRVGIVATSLNEDDIAATRQLLVDRGFGASIRVDAQRPTGRGAGRASRPRRFDSHARQPQFVARWRDYRRNQTRNSCWHGKLAVTSTGDVVPCIFARDEVLGNARSRSFGEILGSQRLQALWAITHDDVPGCNACEYRYACRDCRALPLTEKGELYGKSPRCAYDPLAGTWASATPPQS